ncbi:MAG: hypothetical protein AAGF95_17225 [Chloroflexota bacterium]
MVRVDMSTWPIVLIEVDGLATLAAMEEYNTAMEKLLDYAEQQPEPFGMIYLSQMTDADHEQHKREKAAQKLSNNWLKDNKARIAQQCVGIAMVTSATGMMKMMKPIAKLSMKRLMGAPGDVFFTQTEAESWMAERMTTPEQT